VTANPGGPVSHEAGRLTDLRRRSLRLDKKLRLPWRKPAERNTAFRAESSQLNVLEYIQTARRLTWVTPSKVIW